MERHWSPAVRKDAVLTAATYRGLLPIEWVANGKALEENYVMKRSSMAGHVPELFRSLVHFIA
jgi:hypothetical protein